MARAVRAAQWWDYKIVPILALFYATAFLLGLSVASLWATLLLLLAALMPGAAYVSLVNDLADRADDLAAGKPNRLQGRGNAFVAAALTVPVAAGAVVAWLWRDDPLLLGCYLAAWTAFSLYSLPPFRLKRRGFAGVVADAAGAHLFPSLVAILLAFRAGGQAPDPLWMMAAGAWALAYGIRGILWHQLLDSEADRIAAVPTFVQRHPRRRIVALARFVLFPAELIALALLLALLATPLPLIALIAYAWLVGKRLRVFRMVAVLVEPKPRYLILLQEYYGVLLPLGLLAASALRHPIDLVVLAAHLILFPAGALRTLRDAWTLLRA